MSACRWFLVAVALVGAIMVGACILGPKPDDPSPAADGVDGGIASDTGGGGGFDVGADAALTPDTSSTDTGTAKTDGASDTSTADGPVDGDAADAADGDVAPSDATDATDASDETDATDAVDGDAADAGEGG